MPPGTNSLRLMGARRRVEPRDVAAPILRSARLGAEPPGDEDSFQQIEEALDDQRQQRGGDGPLEDQRHVVEPDSGEDRLAEPARADQRAQRGGPDVDDGRALDSGQDRPERQRQLDAPEDRAPRSPSASADSRSPRGSR